MKMSFSLLKNQSPFAPVRLVEGSPLIISSGGNSGSQASTLVIRAMALGRAGVGFLRIILWPSREAISGELYALIGMAVGTSLIGIVYGELSRALCFLSL